MGSKLKHPLIKVVLIIWFFIVAVGLVYIICENRAKKEMINYINQKYPGSKFLLVEIQYDFIGRLAGYNGGSFVGIVASQGNDPIRFAIYYQQDKSLTDTYLNNN